MGTGPAAAIYAEIWETRREEVDRFFPRYFDMPGEWQRFAYPGGPLLLQDVGFGLEAGRPLCLLGPNGTGKTTLLRGHR